MHEQDLTTTGRSTGVGAVQAGSSPTASPQTRSTQSSTSGQNKAAETAKHVAGSAADAGKQAATDVAATAKDEALRVAQEATQQARSLAADVKQRMGGEVRGQQERVTGGLRQVAGELRQMSADRGDSPASALVNRVAESSNRLADYLEERGPEGVLNEVQDFARRKPGTFLLGAAVAGFVVGRMGKGVWAASHDSGDSGRGLGRYDTSSRDYNTARNYAGGYSGVRDYEGTGLTTGAGALGSADYRGNADAYPGTGPVSPYTDTAGTTYSSANATDPALATKPDELVEQFDTRNTGTSVPGGPAQQSYGSGYRPGSV